VKLVSSGQMQEIDRRAIEGMGIPSLDLMENAGRGIAEAIRDLYGGDVSKRRILIFCGKGNNGGDGFVVGRYLNAWGARIELFILAAPEDYKGDAKANYGQAVDLGISIERIESVERMPDTEDADLLVDALFGTGLTGAIRPGIFADVIEWMNSTGLPVAAVDTPSGLNNDTGEVAGPCIRADHTFTLALPKTGQYFYPGRSQCGQITIIDIGMPPEAEDGVDSKIYLVTDDLVSETIPDREPTTHKGSCGKLFILAGSVGMTGAAAMAAEAAVKAGAGLVYVGIPESLNDILEVKLTEPLTRPLPELRKKRALPVRALGQILENIGQVDACCLGPGVGRHFETIELFQRLVGKIRKPAVIDADGLFAFSEKFELLRESPAELILTPHAGEFARLSGQSIPRNQFEALEPLREYAAAIQQVVLFKGAPSLICSPDGVIYLSSTGNPGMASGGTGDVLTGTIGALLALGLLSFEAAYCGAFLHGFAGDLAQLDIGTFGLTATDVCDYLPEAFLRIKS
jgi:NAD(P)H-hydrate epimerase